MSRTDKGLAVARYITGRTGIPGCSWDGGHSAITMPYPYRFDVTTSRKLQNWHDHIRGYPDEGPIIHGCIRYDRQLDAVSHAWVGMTLGTAARLLEAHYQHITEGTEGATNGTANNPGGVRGRRRP